ncbi:hypothetical protein KCP75_19030 [Salmonella enterica subsp. enterica]|nr:hypothetical protein KCP75_19030 [Salmonella enterica subsp. enterica]
MDQSRIVEPYCGIVLPPVVSAAGDDYGSGNGCRTGCRTLYLAVNIRRISSVILLAGRQPDIQVNVDATRMSQAFTGSSYIREYY